MLSFLYMESGDLIGRCLYFSIEVPQHSSKLALVAHSPCRDFPCFSTILCISYFQTLEPLKFHISVFPASFANIMTASRPVAAQNLCFMHWLFRGKESARSGFQAMLNMRDLHERSPSGQIQGLYSLLQRASIANSTSIPSAVGLALLFPVCRLLVSMRLAVDVV